MALFNVPVGTSSVAVCGINYQRRKLTFHNPNYSSQALIWVLPFAGIPALNNGLLILPGQYVPFSTDLATSAWNVIASAVSSTVIAYEGLWPPATMQQPQVIYND